MSSSNSCVIILTYPNTENKINILLKSIRSAKKLNVPIFVFSNMDIDKKYLSDVNEFIFTGENLMVSASDYLPIDKITLARNTTKYRFHLEFDENIITSNNMLFTGKFRLFSFSSNPGKHQ